MAKKTLEKKISSARGGAKKTVKRARPKKAVPKKTRKRVARVKLVKEPAATALNLDAFSPESFARLTRGLCLACSLEVLIRHVGLSPERAHSEIRRGGPSLEELSTPVPPRPYFAWPADACPYCGAASKWLASLDIIRIEGGKTTDVARRVLIKKVERSKGFTIIEEKSTERDAFYLWLVKTGASLDLDAPGWLLEAAHHWLARRLPKEQWGEIFKLIRFVRRSRRLEDGFEVEGQRLFLAPALFDEVLLIQYLLSRSHKAGGQTFEGRLTLRDLFHRLRGGGYLRKVGIATHNPSEALEQLVEMLGGEGRVKFYYIVDRRDVLARLTTLKGARVPRPKQ